MRIAPSFCRSLAYLLAIASMFFSLVTSAYADPKLIELKPFTPWHSDWQQDSCVLRRGFGSEKEISILSFERFGPGNAFQLIIISNEFRNLERGRRVVVTFGDGEQQDYSNKYQIGETKDGTTTLFFPSSSLVPWKEDTLPTPPVVDPSIEAGIMQVSVEMMRRRIVFKTGELGKPFASFRECVDHLVRNWGFDPGAQRTWTRQLDPKSSPGTWLKPRDYPYAALSSGRQAIVNFVLFVDKEGVPTECRLPRSYSGEGFEKITCSKLMERARFEPALDEQGNPVASFYFNTVSWIMQ